ncbi:TPA: hypothetical protein EYN98_06220 [Candidatus Poribacteria bacterium]|nr:hypothetical protein [Candidatus Poribacteria bacterium]
MDLDSSIARWYSKRENRFPKERRKNCTVTPADLTFQTDFATGNGQIYSNYVNTAITLVDVPKDNGFTCIPGTHKSQIDFPDTIGIDNEWAPAETFELTAGDCLVFSSRLMHGARFWKMGYPRMVIFNRYQFSFYFNENYNLPIEKYKHLISADQYELESVQRGEKAFAKHILKKLDKGEELC